MAAINKATQYRDIFTDYFWGTDGYERPAATLDAGINMTQYWNPPMITKHLNFLPGLSTLNLEIHYAAQAPVGGGGGSSYTGGYWG